ncbi:MAG: outer membrane protein assembly factor BamD [Chitinispirillaceae bacterium]|nr:outer membrane protein assembly factor BamD [Chitinispirillaceae bacterium]
MRDRNNNIEHILEKGFARLPVDDATTAKAIGEVVRCGKEAQRARKILPLRRIEPRRRYAFAAALVLSIGTGYLLLHELFFPPVMKFVKSPLPDEELRYNVAVVSAVNDADTDTVAFRDTGNEFSTDKKLQLLLAVGIRTRTILFDLSRIQVERTDSLYTVISLRQGEIAVDVAPGGRDTVSIATAYGSFTQLGTRFSVSADSIRGATAEVYRGSVRVRSIDGRDIILNAGQAWESCNRDIVTTVHRKRVELEELGRAFTDNKLEHFLHRGSDVLPHSTAVPEKPPSRRRVETSGPVGSVIDVVQSIRAMADRGDYQAVDSAVARLNNPAIADTVAGMLLTLSQRKKEFFRFIDAQRLLEAVVNAVSFSPTRREFASVQRYMLLKTGNGTPSDDLLRELKRHRKHFIEGSFGEDMAAEAIALLMSMKKYDEAVHEITEFLRQYPHHPQNDYYCYLHASTLRENLHRDAEALVEYQRYISQFPHGKYGEDALYRTLQLSLLARDMVKAGYYKKEYMRRHPHGRWVGEIRAIDVTAHR